MFFLSWNPSKSFQIRCQDAANNIEPTTGIDIALPASKLHKFGLQFLSFRRAKSKPCLPATTLISETPNHLKNQTHFTTHTHTHKPSQTSMSIFGPFSNSTTNSRIPKILPGKMQTQKFLATHQQPSLEVIEAGVGGNPYATLPRKWHVKQNKMQARQTW